MRKHLHWLFLALLGAACSLDVTPSENDAGGGGPPPPPPPPTTVSFQLDILPLFQAECILCHGSAGGLDLDSFQAVMAGGNTGPVVVPGMPDLSLLVMRIEGTPSFMPPDPPFLPPSDVQTIRTWILEGAQDN